MAGSLTRSTRADELEEAHEINVTPFIDVMLVLLIIFMIAAPLATVDVNVDLPGSTATPAPRPADPIYLTVKEDLSLVLGEAPVDPSLLGGAIDGVAGGDKQTRVFLRADTVVPYGVLMQVMNLLRAAGYLKIALVGLEQVPASAAASGEAPAEAAAPLQPTVP